MHLLLHVLTKLETILHTLWGWVLWTIFAIANYFAGHAFIVYLVIAVTIMDACWGIAVSLKRGEFTLSELMRLTIDKVAVYGCALFVFVGLDKIVGETTLSTSVIGSAIVLVEFWSSCASMLIIYPNMPFLKLLRKALTGEIASKLRVGAEEVENALKGGKKDDNG